MEGCPVSPNDNTLHTDFHIFHSCWVGVIQICSLDSLISKQSQPPLQSGRILSLSPFRRGQGDGDKVSYCIFVCWAFTIFSRQHLTAAMWKIPRRFSLSDPLEDVETWGESVDKVLSCKAGQIAFREFLKSEYSEENILFWLACEDYKKIKTVPEMISSANRIYSEFVQTEAPKQINIDCGTRENITKNISQPTLTSFDTAQKLIYSLMARDCYPRFLKSDIYQGLLRRTDSR
ncbi:regulator of G-protein signaling 21-like isoform X2 [Sparus aurata]|uniref:regulator of G-protein signaling 21-like isoform X2 n=1 Tax=Sparus aurata TaxID=8175 RepID=UPI0011C1AAF3|nr:regulator of G-protein signaling 21-like isoform X2 [Sparus aurata]